MDQLYIVSNSGWNNKIGVAGFRFLRRVAGKVYCVWEYKEWQWCACLNDAPISSITSKLFLFEEKVGYLLTPFMPQGKCDNSSYWFILSYPSRACQIAGAHLSSLLVLVMFLMRSHPLDFQPALLPALQLKHHTLLYSYQFKKMSLLSLSLWEKTATPRAALPPTLNRISIAGSATSELALPLLSNPKKLRQRGLAESASSNWINYIPTSRQYLDSKTRRVSLSPFLLTSPNRSCIFW